MSNRPSNDAIAQAFWEAHTKFEGNSPGGLSHWIQNRAREIDAAKPLEALDSITSKTLQSGRVVVPKEPTVTMVTSAIRKHWNGAVGDLPLAAMYKVMVEAAPTPLRIEEIGEITEDFPGFKAIFLHGGRMPPTGTKLYTAQPAPTPDLIRDAALCSGYAGGMLVSDNEKHVIHLHYESRKQVEAAYECLTGRIDAAIREQQRGEKDNG